MGPAERSAGPFPFVLERTFPFVLERTGSVASLVAMNKALLTLLAVTIATGCSPTSAQTAQDELDGRYERALAAGYKALMMCGAIGNAEAALVNDPAELQRLKELSKVRQFEIERGVALR